MKFGALELDKCLGAVLVHSQKLGGQRIAKGSVLDAALIEAFRQEGVTSLVCARPETEDLGENNVAEMLAERLAKELNPEDMEVSQAVTGRVNFKAVRPGLIRYERSALRDFNMVHEGLGLSLPSHNQLLHAGQIAATLKVIPYFLHQKIVAELTDKIGDAPLFTYHPLVPKKAYLIQTQSPALPDKVYSATEMVTRDRLAELRCDLLGAAVCAHKLEAVTNEIKIAYQQGAELILICGGSAIMDRQDVVPASIQQLGGQIEQLGLAVDPGNLLMVAQWQNTPIIGMPGCARSPKLNGFDWVLHLLLAGVALSKKELADLGAGGLLTEIASRPLPRLKAVEASQSAYMPAKRLAALLLAAGQSRRMGAENKLLLEIEKKPIIRHAAEALLQAGLTEIYVVTGHQAEAVRACLAGLNLSFIDNPNYARGQASSVSCGIAGLPEAVSDVLIALGDMPLIEAELISALCQRHSETAFDGAKITLPVYTHPTQPDNLKRGNPVIWSQAYFGELKSLSGDQGGRQILADYPAHIQHLHWPDAQPFEDVDTKEALQIMRHYISKK